MINVSTILPQIFNGIQLGVLMALLATGLSLIFGMIGIVNFAHGAFYMLGAYAVWSLMQLFSFSGNFWVGLIIAFLIMALLGVIMERGLLHRMYGRPVVYQILITMGLLLVIEQGVGMVYGTQINPLPVPPALRKEVSLGLFNYPLYYLVTMILGLIVMFAVWFFIERSSLGAIIRACAEDSETAGTLGVNTQRIFTFSFGLGTALAGFGGGLHAPMLGGLQHTMGGQITLACFIVVIVGGMGNIRGAMIAGILLGVVRGLVSLFWAPASDFVMYVVMGLILIFRPQGLLGKKV